MLKSRLFRSVIGSAVLLVFLAGFEHVSGTRGNLAHASNFHLVHYN